MKNLPILLLSLIISCASFDSTQLDEKEAEAKELRLEIAEMSSELNDYINSIGKLSNEVSKKDLIIDSLRTEINKINIDTLGTICLPREQVEALLIDAKTLLTTQEEITLKDSLIDAQELTITWQDSTIFLLQEEITLKDSIMVSTESIYKNNDISWYKRYTQIIVAFLSGISIGGLIK